MTHWTPQDVAAIIVAITGLVTALGAGIGALKAHQKINDHYENDHTDIQNVDTPHSSSN